MSKDGQGTKRRRNIAENFNRLSMVHERYRQTTDERAIAYSEREREFAFAKNVKNVKSDKISQTKHFWAFHKNITHKSNVPRYIQGNSNIVLLWLLTWKSVISFYRSFVDLLVNSVISRKTAKALVGMLIVAMHSQCYF